MVIVGCGEGSPPSDPEREHLGLSRILGRVSPSTSTLRPSVPFSTQYYAGTMLGDRISALKGLQSSTGLYLHIDKGSILQERKWPGLFFKSAIVNNRRMHLNFLGV